MQELDFTVTRVPIAYYRNYPKGYSLTMKSRSSHGLTLILKGELEMTLPDRKITACAGDILLQRSGDAYGLYCPSDSGVEYVVISYQVDCEEALLSLLPDRFFATEHLKQDKE
jgi:ethanolamine utilization protein EutQ (cupin superfamily)